MRHTLYNVHHAVVVIHATYAGVLHVALPAKEIARSCRDCMRCHSSLDISCGLTCQAGCWSVPPCLYSIDDHISYVAVGGEV